MTFSRRIHSNGITQDDLHVILPDGTFKRTKGGQEVKLKGKKEEGK
jgi:hypothetical protein